MLLPATIHRTLSCTKTLAAWRGFQGAFGSSVQLTPSEEYQTSFRLPPALLHPSRTQSRSSKTATSWYCLGGQVARGVWHCQRSPSYRLRQL
jgi:hypothetical protein